MPIEGEIDLCALASFPGNPRGRGNGVRLARVIYLALYWHEAAFESFRYDKPDKVETLLSQDAMEDHSWGEWATYQGNGATFSRGPDKAKQARAAKYFEKAMKLAPQDKEVLYIEALHEKDRKSDTTFFFNPTTLVGESFWSWVLSKLAAAARDSSRPQDAAKWSAMLDDRLRRTKWSRHKALSSQEA